MDQLALVTEETFSSPEGFGTGGKPSELIVGQAQACRAFTVGSWRGCGRNDNGDPIGRLATIP